MSVPEIEPVQLDRMRARGEAIDVVDVRTPAEFREIHADAARNVPIDALDPAAVMNARNGAGRERLYVICRTGSRGRAACERFVAAGFTNVVNVTGGTLAWEQAGLPVVRGRKAVSLERQVRIVAGSLVLIGVALGWLIHPWFVGLSAFVGGGLVFAGVTDRCGMALLLARLPWNSGGAECTAARCNSK